MTFPTLGTIAVSATDTAWDASQNIDLAGVTVPSGYQTLLVGISMPGAFLNGDSINSVHWDSAGVNEALTPCGSILGDTSWGAGQWWILSNPTAGASKNIHVNASTVSGRQGTIIAIPIQEAVSQIAYNSASFNDVGGGTYDDTVSAITTVAGDAIFSLHSDDIGNGNGTVTYLSGTQDAQVSSGSSDTWNSFGHQVATGISTNDTWHSASVTTGGTSATIYLVLRQPLTGPIIRAQPVNLNVVYGSQADFSIQALSSGGALHYQWKRNGSNVGSDQPSYSLSTVSADHRAQITCTVTDDNGSTLSTTATLLLSWHDVYLYGVPGDADPDDVRLRNPFIAGVTGGTLLKFYNGSTFLAKPCKVWDGGSWVTKPVKRWNGSSWV